MLTVNIFIILLLISSVSTINDTIPDIPSQLLSNTKLLPNRSKSTKTDLIFEKYIPVACFCDWSKCNANVQSVELPIVGLFTCDGKIVMSLNVQVNKGELMFIILIDRMSSLSDDTYLERTSYWNLIDSQHELRAGAPLDFEIRRQVSVSVLKENSLPFSLENEIKDTVITALEKSSGLSILTPDEFANQTHYYYSASESSQAVGVYQLFHELVTHPGPTLTNYVQNKETGARCSRYWIVRGTCGSLQLLPPFLQRTSVFRQVTVNFTTTSNLETTDANQQKLKRRGLSRKAKATIISLLLVGIVFVVFVAAITYYCKRRRLSPNHPSAPEHMAPVHSDGSNERETNNTSYSYRLLNEND